MVIEFVEDFCCHSIFVPYFALSAPFSKESGRVC